MIDLLKILPNLLKEDEFSKNISLILNKYLNEISDTYDNLFLMKNLDKFDDRVLDEIAKDKSIVWYDSALSIDQKIKIIRSHRLVYRVLGSEKAVLQLIQDYFGSSGSIQNWHEYGGTHHRFKITLNDLPHVESFLDFFYRFLDSLMWVKSADTWLDGVTINRNVIKNMYLGSIVNLEKRSFLDFFYRFLDSLMWVKSADTWLDGVTINRNVIKNMYLGSIVNLEKRANIIIKPYSDKALVNLYDVIVINKIKRIGVNIKVVTGAVQQPFFIGILVNKVKNKEVNIKFNTKNQGNYFNSLILNSIKIREVNFNRESKFKSFIKIKAIILIH